VCGSCTVLVDGTPVAACSKFAFQIDGSRVTTVEGLGAGGALDPVQQAFVDNAAFQCGYCTSGMILLSKALLAHDPDPDRATIVEWLSSNVCRCTGYTQIIAAVEDAARRLRQGAPS
jgi:aerobic carbon-monoxide dehydrogenase small subunit